MSEITSEADALRAPASAPLADSLEASPFETAATARAELAAADDARTELRRQADKAELRLAFRDLAEGLRGMIRSAPLASVGVAAALGMLWSRPRRRRAPPRRR